MLETSARDGRLIGLAVGIDIASARTGSAQSSDVQQGGEARSTSGMPGFAAPEAARRTSVGESRNSGGLIFENSFVATQRSRSRVQPDIESGWLVHGREGVLNCSSERAGRFDSRSAQ